MLFFFGDIRGEIKVSIENVYRGICSLRSLLKMKQVCRLDDVIKLESSINRFNIILYKFTNG